MRTAIHCGFLFSLIVLALVVAADNVPQRDQPDQVEPITCAGKERCEVVRFMVADDRIAYCELRWRADGRPKPGRCIIDPPRDGA